MGDPLVENPYYSVAVDEDDDAVHEEDDAHDAEEDVVEAQLVLRVVHVVGEGEDEYAEGDGDERHAGLVRRDAVHEAEHPRALELQQHGERDVC